MRIVLLLLAVSLCPFARAAEVTIATANPAGTYFLVGSALNSILESDHDVNLDVMETAGLGREPAVASEWKGPALPSIQSDILAERRGRLDSPDLKGLQGIAVLFQEYTQIIVRSKSRIQRPLNLVGRRLYMGAPGSGSRKNATDILAAMGVQPGDYELVEDYSSTDAAIQGLREADIDAVITTNSRLLTHNPAQGADLELVSLPSAAQERIRGVNRLYSFADVENTDGSPATLMTTRAVLVTARSESGIDLHRCSSRPCWPRSMNGWSWRSRGGRAPI
ncbi:MAG: TAXI family TRAP transporter solute-binding subunit [Gammaproteobacteria bacterium]|nr:TAXI family TRAP transporter solute-binding subunit [Gammaproteobacteria bacterium]